MMTPARTETPQEAARRIAGKAIDEGFQPQALHVVTDSVGSPLHWIIRLKHPLTGDKWIRPMKQDGDRFVLGEPHYPKGKPLYCLHELASRPEEPVFVTEGPWCADWLRRLGALSTTSGGADSAGAADWTPLAGRLVFLWPDSDEAGKRYLSDVRRILETLVCEIKEIDVQALGLADGEDAVDWLAENVEAGLDTLLALPIVSGAEIHVRNATPTEFPSPEEEEHHVIASRSGRYEIKRDGVSFIGVSAEGREFQPL